MLCFVGRKKGFDNGEVLAHFRRAFLTHGYEGTSIDDLVNASGLLRGSLYAAFGSKRGMFIAALHEAIALDPSGSDTRGLVLVALMELSAGDVEIRTIAQSYVESMSSSDVGGSQNGLVAIQTTLGKAILKRACVQLKITTMKEDNHG